MGRPPGASGEADSGEGTHKGRPYSCPPSCTSPCPPCLRGDKTQRPMYLHGDCRSSPEMFACGGRELLRGFGAGCTLLRRSGIYRQLYELRFALQAGDR
jgi:hypothetical protein